MTNQDYENYTDQCEGGAAQAAAAVKWLCEQGRLSIGETRFILNALGVSPWSPDPERAKPVKRRTQLRVALYSDSEARAWLSRTASTTEAG